MISAARSSKPGNTGGPALSTVRIDAIIDRLLENRPVRRSFPEWGRLHIDRQLPFLCVYRRPQDTSDEMTDRLIVAEAAYATGLATKTFHHSFVNLLTRISEIMVDRFGAYLIVEVWAGKSVGTLPKSAPPRPGFCIHQLPGAQIPNTLNAFREGLQGIRTLKQKAEVTTRVARTIAPPGMPQLFTRARLAKMRCHLIGLEIEPIYLKPQTGEPFPLLVRSLKHQLGHVLDRTFYAFAHEQTTHQPPHFHALGRRAMVKAVWEADRRLAAVSNTFDLLYQVTPVNAERAWTAFKRNRLEKPPDFLYRPRVVDPALIKRALYDIHIERVEDPTLMHLLLDKQIELDRQLTMLHDLGTKAFLYESLQLHGPVSPALVKTARRILDRTPSRRRDVSRAAVLTATAFAKRARSEFEWYAERFSDFKAAAQVSDDMYSGLIVTRGKLIIGSQTRIPEHRADALLQHEVGTHLLTYFNGRAQPFKMLCTGLPGYDELQEGLAVLAEYLVGGLTIERLRVLAARVVAAHALVAGASFIDVFRLLQRNYEFPQRSAYTIVMRIFRGGGLVKDAVYLRGLIHVLKYLAGGGDFDMLFVGKIATGHVGVIEELLLRKILKPAPVFPRYLEAEQAQHRLRQVRRGMTVLDLIET